jgi:hypothetical protein
MTPLPAISLRGLRAGQPGTTTDTKMDCIDACNNVVTSPDGGF